jgi:membrane-associated phospholipid phosphatase
LGVFCIVYRVVPGPEFIALIFFIYAAYNKKTRRFIGDWAPFIFIFLSFEALYGIVGGIDIAPHVMEPIMADLRLFDSIPPVVLQQFSSKGFISSVILAQANSIPTVVLQQLYRSPFLDYLGAFFYSLHFIAPTVFAFVLWKYSPKNFGKFTLALAIGVYSALVTFLVYPVAPPWIGVNEVYGAGTVVRVLFRVDQNMGIPFFRTLYDYFSSDSYAAFPSLHAMFPWLISLFALKIKKTRALPILILPAGVWFSAVYLGEHYVVDIIGGIIYATCAFLLVEKLVPRITPKIWHAQTNTTKRNPTGVEGAIVH